MTPATPRVVRFGRARTLTQDLLKGAFTEVHAYDSLFPPIG